MMSFVLFAILLLNPLALATSTVSRRGRAICGVHGYDTGTEAYFYESSPGWANYEKCSVACASRSKCKSFAFGAAACLLYKVSAYVENELSALVHAILTVG